MFGQGERQTLVKRLFRDELAEKFMQWAAIFGVLLTFLMVAGLLWKSWPILSTKPLGELLFSVSWSPLRGQFGFLPFIMGTVWVTLVAVVIAVPLCLLTAIYLSEYAPKTIRHTFTHFVDILAGIPSVIYGMWGMLVIVPLIKDRIAPAFGMFSTGYCVLAGGVVLAIMIAPVIIHISIEVFNSVSGELKEASLSLGATKWQTIKHIVVRKAMPGLIAAVVLGVSRALGETMAVLMVAGNVARPPHSVFDPAYPLPALIANNYGEMLSIPLYDSVLLLAAFFLLVFVMLFNVVSRIVLMRIEKYAD